MTLIYNEPSPPAPQKKSLSRENVFIQIKDDHHK